MASSSDSYQGVLLVDKPSGMTSHDVIDYIRRTVKQRSVGHAGTLDPAAEGLLIICLGKATKIARFLTGHDKTYVADVRLGRESVTFDAEGLDDSAPTKPPPSLSEKEIEELLSQFRGHVTQTVPVYSAVHVDGQRLYEKARRGEKVEAPSREVDIHRIDLITYEEGLMRLEIECSKGTYIRSIAHEIGSKLGCGAYLSHLRRTASGRFGLEDALTLDDVEELCQKQELDQNVIPIERALDLSAVRVSDDFCRYVQNGRTPTSVDIVEVEGDFIAGDDIMVKNPSGLALALATAKVSSEGLSQKSGTPVYKYNRVLC